MTSLNLGKKVLWFPIQQSNGTTVSVRSHPQSAGFSDVPTLPAGEQNAGFTKKTTQFQKTA